MLEGVRSYHVRTQAAVAFAPSQPLPIIYVELRDPRPDEVLVRLQATGICHSDIAALDGYNKLGSFPIVLGHEGAGIIERIGTSVTSVAPGDPVVVSPIPQCGGCSECLSGRSNLCLDMYRGFSGDGSPFSTMRRPIGRFMHAGTFARHSVILESGVSKIRGDAPLDRA